MLWINTTVNSFFINHWVHHVGTLNKATNFMTSINSFCTSYTRINSFSDSTTTHHNTSNKTNTLSKTLSHFMFSPHAITLVILVAIFWRNIISKTRNRLYPTGSPFISFLSHYFFLFFIEVWRASHKHTFMTTQSLSNCRN